jgi:hypothetical protein
LHEGPAEIVEGCAVPALACLAMTLVCFCCGSGRQER